MNFGSIGGNVDHLLAELHEKKRWLDIMIESLEAAKDSPQHQLIDLAARTFGESSERSPKVDLQTDSKQELAALAKKVQPGRRALARRKKRSRT